MTVPPAASPPADLGRIRVLERLGEGGMGEVWVGYDEVLQRKVALKRIRSDRALDPEIRARLLREARLLSRLAHPGICAVHDFVEHESGSYIVLELVEGQTLKEAMRQGLRWSRRLDVAEQIAGVLVSAHAAGVVHRDLKPANVMVTPAGGIKVLDFGIAHADDGQSLTLAGPGGVLGTPGYMSPEQACAEPVTPATDMYAFGLLLQELLTGRPAFDSSLSPQALLARTLAGDSESPSGLPRDLARLVDRLKARNPSDRPAALEAAQVLRRAREAPRRRLRRLAAVAAIVAAVAGLTKYVVDLRRERNRALAARAEADAAHQGSEELVSFMLDDLYASLEPVGRLDLLEQVSGKALAHYLEPGAVGASVPAERTAEALRKLAAVLESQGRLGEALDALDRAEATFRSEVEREPGAARCLEGLCATLIQQGRVLSARGNLDGAAQALEEAAALGARLTADDPGNRTAQARQAEVDTELGRVLSYRGETKRARGHFERALAALDRLLSADPQRTDWLCLLAEAHARLGDMLETQSRLEEGLEAQERARAILQRLTESDPRNLLWLQRLARAHYGVGSIHEARGDAREALVAYQNALDIEKRLVAQDASNAEWRSKLAAYHSRVGRVQALDRHFEEAADQHRHAIAIYGELVRQSPGNADLLNNLAWNMVLLGRDLEAMGNREGARREWGRAVELVEPTARSSADLYLLDTLAMALLHLDRVEEARPVILHLRRAGWSDPAFLEVCRRHGISDGDETPGGTSGRP